ncbi:hypothetical protein [Qipengyuania qiaonensis]|uniref:Lipoprotein n=1 Tax=Qipengyuania qiaonensis TaxID=2867240 RepID=A0ABS7J9K5_9SPHN|nr:hypothetical protein [Qipengyuania qiaonensis]MBX7483977.1 hypothetical protein [Qipengyuania qiaonensis]
MKHVFATGALAVLVLSACNQSDPAGDEPTVADLEGQPGEIAPPVAPPPPDGSVDGENDGYPNLDPAPLTPEAERGETGARNVLLSFARAIELREFDQAWGMLDEGDQAKWSKAEWRALFAGLGEITVAVPSGTMEGAAGSSYYTSQATITANDKEGRPVRYEGPVVLRRVNDVPGASAEQLRWHIDSVQFDSTH